MKIDNPVQYLRETADILWAHGTRAGHRSKMLLSVASHFDIVVDEWQFGARSAADTQRLLSCVGLATALRRDVREEEEEEEAAKTNVPTGWRPPVRVITAVDELSALPEMAIIRDKEGRVLELAERDAAGRMYW